MASLVLGSLVGAIVAIVNLNGTLGSLDKITPILQNQHTDTGMYDDVIHQTEPKTTTTSENNGKIKTITLAKGSFVLVYGPIDETANQIAEAVKVASQNNDEVYILIDSPGGNIITGGAIISAMEASPVPVNTVCLQLCASMGAMIHQYGVKRYTVNRSLLMFHDASGGFVGPFQQVASQVNMINRFVNKMFANTAKRSGQKYKDFVSKLGSEIWVDGEDAVEQKYSDEMVNVIYNDLDAVNPPQQKLIELNNQFKRKILKLDYIK